MVANEGTVGGDTALLKRMIEPLYRAKIWMQLVGVMLILSGLLTALTIIGILICWIPIWAGIVLMQAAGSVDLAYTDGNSEAAVGAMRRLKTYFTIFGVLTLVYLALTVIGMLFGLSAGMMGAAQMGM
ncbi:MAG: DUF5362 family protein [Halofilum sp. (in: g-proteobacteria)]|nr:DUF5362 family protein [Halofilum sp. (in: g-proteobacteria)]